MNTKFVTASVFAFFSASTAQAADVVALEQPQDVASSIVVASPFSWSGFYFGAQGGGFSSKASAMTPDVNIPLYPDESSKNKKWIPIEEKYWPKLSGFVAGIYAGANIEMGNGFILGVDTDMLFSERKATKTEMQAEPGEPVESQVKSREEGTDTEEHETNGKENRIDFKHTFKQKWAGATRVRVGWPIDRIMPYISGGLSYGQFQDILSTSITGEEEFSQVADTTKTMIGYTLGGGIDFAMTDNLILRAEYRYSDFGKKKFNDHIEIKYKTNDFRAGIAYKF
ncbi:opacity protein-like surface antigen [Bartonella silvatica]|uniref:Opacity protein-like surface antigen n=1 Tax=Bartonella silvatica TaxID=357760 RepID=A0ABV2HFU9_9HYPH